jgi:hypothetical protein
MAMIDYGSLAFGYFNSQLSLPPQQLSFGVEDMLTLVLNKWMVFMNSDSPSFEEFLLFQTLLSPKVFFPGVIDLLPRVPP